MNWFFFFFLLRHMACGIWDLSSQPGIEPGPQQWKCRVLTTGPPGNSRTEFFEFSNNAVYRAQYEPKLYLLKLVPKILSLFFYIRINVSCSKTQGNLTCTSEDTLFRKQKLVIISLVSFPQVNEHIRKQK